MPSRILIVLQFVLLVSEVVFWGCGRRLTSVDELIDSRLGDVKLSSWEDVDLGHRKCKEIIDGFRAESPRRFCQFARALGVCFRRIGFDERSYATRGESLTCYFSLVQSISEELLAVDPKGEPAWVFKLEALGRINDEIVRCEKEPRGGVYGDLSGKMGFVLTQSGFMQVLKHRRFNFVREGFEYGKFTRYFHGLSDERQKEWMVQLEKLACREVVICHPEGKHVKMPTYRPDANLGKNPGDGRREWIEDLGDGRQIRMKAIVR